MKLVTGIVSLFLLFSCEEAKKDPSSAEVFIKAIKEKEEALVALQNSNKEIPFMKQAELTNSLVDFYRKFPKDPNAPVCLDKAHMAFSGAGRYRDAASIADTLLANYPKYINREMILESQAAAFDIFIEPRDTVKVRNYYSLLLKEFPKMEGEKKRSIEMRLKHLEMNFDEYLTFKAKKSQK